MPSGAKKRKAAKKKKDKGTANIINPARGNGDLKAQESDGGETSSPVSQQSQQERPFDEDEKRDPSPVRSFVPDNKSVEVVVNDGDDDQEVVAEVEGVVPIDGQLNSEEGSESKDVRIEHVESAKEPRSGSSSSRSSSSNSSSSSDDESPVVEENSVVLESQKLEEESYNSVPEGNSSSTEVTWVTDSAPAKEDYNLGSETEPVVDLVEPVESVVEKVIPLTENAPVETSINCDVAELGTKEKDEQLLPSLDEKTIVTDFESKKTEEKVYPLPYGNAGESSNANDVASKENVSKLPQSSHDAGESFSANGFASKENESKLSQSSHAPIVETSNGVGQSNAPTVQTSNGVGNIKDSEIPECFENQPLTAATPRQVQTTSWKGCCGLFEVLAGSNR